MKQVKYFDVYSKGKITKYCVNSTEEFRKMVKILKHSDNNSIVTYIEFDDGSNGITDDWCNSVNIKINDENINKTKQATEKALADFRKLSALDKYRECINYGNFTTYFDNKTTDGWLTIRMVKIYGTTFIFIHLSGEVINCYELQ